MAIPDYQSLMLPILKVADDGREHRIGDVVDELARMFGLTEEEQQRLLASGKQAIFANRVGWAKTYLVQARLLEATKRAHFKITDRGVRARRELMSNTYRGLLNSFNLRSAVGRRGLKPPQVRTRCRRYRYNRKPQMNSYVARLGKLIQHSRRNCLIAFSPRPLRFLKDSSLHCSSPWAMEDRGKRRGKLLAVPETEASTA